MARFLALQVTESGTTNGPNTVVLIDASRPKRLKVLGRFGSEIYANMADVAFSRDGSRLVVASATGLHGTETALDVLSVPTLTSLAHVDHAGAGEVHQVMLVGATERILIASGINSATVGSFPLSQ